MGKTVECLSCRRAFEDADDFESRALFDLDDLEPTGNASMIGVGQPRRDPSPTYTCPVCGVSIPESR